jgi:hypothetical protein
MLFEAKIYSVNPGGVAYVCTKDHNGKTFSFVFGQIEKHVFGQIEKYGGESAKELRLRKGSRVRIELTQDGQKISRVIIPRRKKRSR